MAAETLQEYLVKLGWDVNTLGFNNAMKAVNSFKSTISSIGTSLFTASYKLGKAFGAIASTTYKLVNGISKADVAAERFARKMWSTEEQARSLQTALDAVGASYEEIFDMSLEEFQRLLALRDLGLQLQAPAELQDTLKLIRDIQFEFNRLKVIGNYAVQWFTYYLGKYLGKDFKNLRDMFASINDWLIQKMPVWTEKLAKFVSWVIRLGETALKLITGVAKGIKDLWDSLSNRGKAAIGIIGSAIWLLKSGPIGWLIAALTAVLLLLEDFDTWQEGGKSLLGNTWQSLTDWMQSQKALELKETFSSVLDSIVRIAESIGQIIIDTGLWEAAVKLVDAAFGLIADTVSAIADSLDTMADILKALTGTSDFDDYEIQDPEYRKIKESQDFGTPLTEDARILKNLGILTSPYSKSGEGPLYVTEDAPQWLKDFYLNPETTSEDFINFLNAYKAQGEYEALRSIGIEPTTETHNQLNTEYKVRGQTRTGDFNQYINITIPGTGNPDDVADRTAKSILQQRKQYNPF